MTLEALKTKLDAAGYPVSYSAVPLDEATARPYICYAETGTRTFTADGIAYYSRRVVSVRLYTETRNEAAEANVEAALAGLYWSKGIEYLDDQKIYEITYEIEV